MLSAYRLIPNPPIPTRTALMGSVTTKVLFEAARVGFGSVRGHLGSGLPR